MTNEQIIALLREAREVLGNYWFSSDGEEDRNNDDAIDISKKIDQALSAPEPTPPRRCMHPVACMRGADGYCAPCHEAAYP